MAVSVTHTTQSVGVNDPGYEVSKNAWNEAHTVSGLGTMAEQNANNVAITGGSITGVTGVQPQDAELTAIAGLASAADTLPYFTGSGTAALTTLTAFGRSLIDDADNSAARTTLGLVIGTNVQAYDADLAAIAGLTSAADALPYFTGVGTAALATFTAAGRAIVDDADAAAQRTTLGLGTIATQAANNVSITGGSVTGITDLAVADGGTGASTAADARANLSAGFTLQSVSATLAAPADSTTYVSGMGITTVYNFARIYIPRAGTLKAVYVSIYVAGTLGSAETFTVSFRLNDTTDTTITSSAQMSATVQNYSATGMSVAVSAGDSFVVKFVSPAWVTNPTNVFFTWVAYFE